jgi:SAM-dependent methyltransferase
MKRHLDLGCGPSPKNTYGFEELYGVDIRSGDSVTSKIIVANLAFEPIPFPDNFFDGVSAYDFFEHVPRVAIDYVSRSSKFPFVELMNEIWRVLKPSGRLYSITPAFPREKSFRDPTHVNIITNKTNRYFTEPQVLARMYGFNGSFELLRQEWVRPRNIYEPNKNGFKNSIRNFGEKITGQQSHLLWEFAAVKPLQKCHETE